MRYIKSPQRKEKRKVKTAQPWKNNRYIVIDLDFRLKDYCYKFIDLCKKVVVDASNGLPIQKIKDYLIDYYLMEENIKVKDKKYWYNSQRRTDREVGLSIWYSNKTDASDENRRIYIDLADKKVHTNFLQFW